MSRSSFPAIPLRSAPHSPARAYPIGRTLIGGGTGQAIVTGRAWVGEVLLALSGPVTRVWSVAGRGALITAGCAYEVFYFADVVVAAAPSADIRRAAVGVYHARNAASPTTDGAVVPAVAIRSTLGAAGLRAHGAIGIRARVRAGLALALRAAAFLPVAEVTIATACVVFRRSARFGYGLPCAIAFKGAAVSRRSGCGKARVLVVSLARTGAVALTAVAAFGCGGAAILPSWLGENPTLRVLARRHLAFVGGEIAVLHGQAFDALPLAVAHAR